MPKKTPRGGDTPRSRAARLDHDISAYLADKPSPDDTYLAHVARGGARGSVVIDHGGIPRDVLQLARENARNDPDGQTFPWRPGYPLTGGTVYHDRRLWTIVRKEGGTYRLASLAYDGAEASATRGELRPVLWTQHDEDRYEAQ